MTIDTTDYAKSRSAYIKSLIRPIRNSVDDLAAACTACTKDEVITDRWALLGHLDELRRRTDEMSMAIQHSQPFTQSEV